MKIENGPESVLISVGHLCENGYHLYSQHHLHVVDKSS